MTDPVRGADYRLRDTERWFYRRGLPFFVEDYRSSTDVWTRATPALAIIEVVLVAIAVASFDDGWGALAGLVMTVCAVGAYVLWNRRRNRSWRTLPERVTWPVLAVFVAVPTLLTLAASRSMLVAGQAMAVALLALVLTWIVTRYAVGPLVGWAVRYTIRGLSDLYRLTTRALPLLLLFITFLFINTEVWQVAGSLAAVHLWQVISLFVTLGVVFVVSRVPEEVGRIEAATTREQVVEACRNSPLAEAAEVLPDLDAGIGLSRRQRANIGLVMAVAQLVQVALFAVVVWAFFVVFGALAISVAVQMSWMDGVGEVDTLWAWGDGHGVTRQLLRVSLFLAAFSGFYVTIYTAMDSAYREHFYDRIRRDLERSLSVRRAYIRLHG